MEIQLTDKWRLRSDARNLILQRKTVNEGKENWVNESYHHSPERLATVLIQKEIYLSSDDVDSFEKLIQVIERVGAEITENLKGVMEE